MSGLPIISYNLQVRKGAKKMDNNTITKKFTKELEKHLYELLRQTNTDEEIRLVSSLFKLVADAGIEI